MKSSSTPRTAASTASAERAIMRPRRTALIITLVYASVSVVYVGMSNRLAADAGAANPQLVSLDGMRGAIFVLLTTLLIFALSYWLLSRLYVREQLLEAHRQALLAAERRATAGLFAASVAHDLNNVLLITEYAIGELNNSQGLSPHQVRLTHELEKANEELVALSRRLVMLSGRHLGEEMRALDLAAFVHEIVRLAQSHSKVRTCNVEVDTPPALAFVGFPSLIHQMLLNLVINAADATRHHGQIRVTLTGDEREATISVHDNGPGIPLLERQRVFDPFYTTKADGTGLGLMSVRACAEVHNGSVVVDASPLGGACFIVHLASLGVTHEASPGSPVTAASLPADIPAATISAVALPLISEQDEV